MDKTIENAELIGHVGVDSGTVMIGDPCYTLPDDASQRDETARTWEVLCSKTDYSKQVQELFGDGMGLIVSSGYGDGYYPVYAERNEEGRILRILVDFDENGMMEKVFQQLVGAADGH